MRGLEAAARQALDLHLRHDSRRSLTVGLSGGGDSLALTLIAHAWAREVGRELVILNVDHGLQPQSGAWTTTCAAIAKRLGRPFRALTWTGDKPRTGLPAAARHARHRLIAEAARESGARVILLGHTADDLAEGETMRAAGGTTPDPRVWAPSPVWPEGRGLFLLRPLMSSRRSEIRDWLQARGETWIDDPANVDPRYARSRARLTEPGARPRPSEIRPLALAERAREQAGVIAIARADLRAATLEEGRRFIRLATVCAGGGERLPVTTRVTRAVEALRGSSPFVATLGGARIEADDGTVRIFREAGEAARGGLAPIHAPGVWDGRFEMGAEGEVRRLAGLARRLAPDEQAQVRALPAAARGALPVIVGADGSVSLAPADSLVGARLRAAAGLVQREPA